MDSKAVRTILFFNDNLAFNKASCSVEPLPTELFFGRFFLFATQFGIFDAIKSSISFTFGSSGFDASLGSLIFGLCSANFTSGVFSTGLTSGTDKLPPAREICGIFTCFGSATSLTSWICTSATLSISTLSIFRLSGEYTPATIAAIGAHTLSLLYSGFSTVELAAAAINEAEIFVPYWVSGEKKFTTPRLSTAIVPIWIFFVKSYILI